MSCLRSKVLDKDCIFTRDNDNDGYDDITLRTLQMYRAWSENVQGLKTLV